MAYDYFVSNDYTKAEIIFNEILSKAESYSAVVGLSKIYEEKDSLSKAIKLFESNLKIYSGISSEYDLKFRLADLYVKSNELEKAIEFYSFLLNARPNQRLELVSSTRLALLKNGTIADYVSGSDYDRYELLKALNSNSYNYSSFPLMIDLSQSLGEDYQKFKSHFVHDIEVKDEISGYAVYKLSEYMIRNFDFVYARKMVSISLRYKGMLIFLVDGRKLFQDNCL
jgi:tetratricopeptide (TPR) repeat protein